MDIEKKKFCLCKCEKKEIARKNVKRKKLQETLPWIKVSIYLYYN